MHNKTIEEEIPAAKEGLLIYRNGIEKELEKYEPIVKRLKLVLKELDKYLERMN